MRNTSKQNIQRYINTITKVYKYNHSFPYSYLTKYRYQLYMLLLSTLFYLYYRKYQLEIQKKKYYFDLFQSKSNLSKNIKTNDFFKKIWNMNFYYNQQYASNQYCKRLNQESDNFINNIQNTKPQQQINEYNNNKIKNKKQKKNPTKQLILSKNTKSSINLGNIIKLNTKQYITTLTNNGNYIRKVYTIPLIIFNVPFFEKIKQDIKKNNKKDKYSKIIINKQKFQFTSQCQNINYWNLLFINKYQQKQDHQKQDNLPNNQINYHIPNYPKPENKTPQNPKSKTQLLTQCKTKVKQIQQQFKQKLKKAIDQNWKNKTINQLQIKNNYFITKLSS